MSDPCGGRQHGEGERKKKDKRYIYLSFIKKFIIAFHLHSRDVWTQARWGARIGRGCGGQGGEEKIFRRADARWSVRESLDWPQNIRERSPAVRGLQEEDVSGVSSCQGACSSMLENSQKERSEHLLKSGMIFFTITGTAGIAVYIRKIRSLTPISILFFERNSVKLFMQLGHVQFAAQCAVNGTCPIGRGCGFQLGQSWMRPTKSSGFWTQIPLSRRAARHEKE